MEIEFDKKYRPSNFDEVIGQDHIINSLKDRENFPHSLIFTGPSGCGKTSISRICASYTGCIEVIEVDAATYSGVDDMRDIAELMKYKSMRSNGKKFLIIDESHMLSKASWNSWLKIIEEPPQHAYFIFCTTEFEKIPQTIKTRCHTYQVREVSLFEIEAILEGVSSNEDIKLPKGGLTVIAKEAFGSPRQALVFLSQCRNCETLDEIKNTIGIAVSGDRVYKLCKALVNNNKNPIELLGMLRDIKDLNPLSVKIQLSRYLNGCVLNSKSTNDMKYFLSMLEVINGIKEDKETGFSSILLAFGEIFLK
jgi:DNA polymerase III subunit gamma/tau